jgi:hypothetical protein
MRVNARMSVLAAAAAISTAALLAACGDDDEPSPASLEITAKDAGKGSYALDAPTDATGGLTEVTLTNDTKAPQLAQLILLEDGHTLDEALEVISSEGEEIPDWLRAEGGIGTIAPGETASTTVNLPEGQYAIVDDAENGSREPATAELSVSGAEEGDLPDTDATVTASEVGDDKYEWEISGLTAGENTLTFNSEGEEALHHIVLAPNVGDATIDGVKNDLESQREPKSIDFENSVDSAVIDGEKSEVTQLNLEAGCYAAICFLPDRDEPDKPHFEEGLLDEVEVK